MSSWLRYLPDNRVKWTSGYSSYPVWASEPDLSAIKEIFISVLSGNFFDEPTKALSGDPDQDVRFLADGAHHKIYEATHPPWQTSFLLRVAVLIDSCLKLESEMATLAYLRQKTKLPVSKPISWSSRVDEKLGYEWSLVEKIPGVELRDVWRQVPWEKKAAIVEEMASFMTRLWDPTTPFSRIGSLYLVEPRPEGNDTHPNILPRKVSKDEPQDLYFAIGPAVDGEFFERRRCFLDSHRGPYNNCQEWLRALIEVEQEFLKSTKVLLDSRSEAPAEYQGPDAISAWEDEIGVDGNDFLKHHDSIMTLCETYLKLLPKVFPEETGGDTNPKKGYLLHHCDLRSANILVDPETFTITGIIDWERTVALPTWYSLEYPMFINHPEPLDDDLEPPIPDTYDQGSKSYDPVMVAIRDRWDARLLRDVFDKKLVELGWPTNWRSTSARDEMKADFIQGVSDLGGHWRRARNVIEGIHEDLEREEEEEFCQLWQET